MAALMISGWVTFSLGKFETGSPINTPPAAITQPSTAPTVSPGSPTTGQAPAR
jgi:hypothetical protein